jgi:hypothetical protein
MWFMPITPPVGEVEKGELQPKTEPGKMQGTLSEKQSKTKMTGGVAQAL